MENTTGKLRARLKSVGKVANRNTFPYDAHSVYQKSLASQPQLLQYSIVHTLDMGNTLKKQTKQTYRTYFKNFYL